MKSPLQELHDMGEVLEGDVNRLIESANTEQFSRRMYARAMFALVEGTVYRMKQICFSDEYGSNVDFSSAELALLREESYDLNEKGRVVTRLNKIQLAKNIRFAFEAFSKYFGTGFELKTDGAGWEAFIKAIKIRNRLTHPKSASELNISDEEFQILTTANEWFAASASVGFDGASEAMERRIEENKNATREIEIAMSKLAHLKRSS